MAVFNEPTQWATSLVVNGDTNVIPQSTPAGSGALSFDDGFPQITQVPLGAGGIAPDRKDFNAVMKLLGDAVFYMQNGGFWSYNPLFDYAVGRVILYTDGNLYKCIQANGASSTVVAPDSVSPLGTDYWVQVATLANFANFANTDLSNLSASGQALFTNKADKDFSNVTAPTQAFKDMSIRWGMPDYSAPISLLGLSTYTAPSDGVFIAYANATGWREISINGRQIARYTVDSSCTVPMRKGDILTSDAGLYGSAYFFPFLGAE